MKNLVLVILTAVLCCGCSLKHYSEAKTLDEQNAMALVKETGYFPQPLTFSIPIGQKADVERIVNIILTNNPSRGRIAANSYACLYNQGYIRITADKKSIEVTDTGRRLGRVEGNTYQFKVGRLELRNVVVIKRSGDSSIALLGCGLEVIEPVWSCVFPDGLEITTAYAFFRKYEGEWRVERLEMEVRGD